MYFASQIPQLAQSSLSLLGTNRPSVSSIKAHHLLSCGFRARISAFLFHTHLILTFASFYYSTFHSSRSHSSIDVSVRAGEPHILQGTFFHCRTDFMIIYCFSLTFCVRSCYLLWLGPTITTVIYLARCLTTSITNVYLKLYPSTSWLSWKKVEKS